MRTSEALRPGRAGRRRPGQVPDRHRTVQRLELQADDRVGRQRPGHRRYAAARPVGAGTSQEDVMRGRLPFLNLRGLAAGLFALLHGTLLAAPTHPMDPLTADEM